VDSKTVAAYYHQCPNPPIQKQWFICPSPPQDPTTGKPAPQPCPDGLVFGPGQSGCGNAVPAKTLYCYTCKVVTVFP
jgi:hypothetical protein